MRSVDSGYKNQEGPVNQGGIDDLVDEATYYYKIGKKNRDSQFRFTNDPKVVG